MREGDTRAVSTTHDLATGSKDPHSSTETTAALATADYDPVAVATGTEMES